MMVAANSLNESAFASAILVSRFLESGLDLFVKGGDEGVQSFVQFQVLQTQAVNIESDMSVMLFLHGYQLAVELPQFCRGSRHCTVSLLAKETCYAVFSGG